MPARITRLATRQQLAHRAQSEELRQAIHALQDQAPDLVSQVLALIDRHTASENGWSFAMVGPPQNRFVVRWINQYAKRPRVSAALWAEFFCNLRTDTGEIVMTRSQMVEAADAPSPNISVALKELVSINALIRHQEGRTVRWFMNPLVGTHLPGAARDEAQNSAPPLLSLIEGGAPAR